MANLVPQGKQYYETAAGIPLVGGQIYTYDVGTTNPRTTWSDAAQSNPNTNPVVLDARGEAVIFWSGDYTVTLKDALGNQIWSVNDVNSNTASLIDNYVVDSGSANAYIANGIPASSYVAGMRVAVKISTRNTGPSTLNYASLGLKNITFGGAPLSGGELQPGNIALFEYDGINFQLLNASLYGTTPAEITAGIIPTSFIYPEHNIMRYGATAAGSGAANAAAIQQAVSVLAQHTDGELLIPAGFVFNVAQVTFTSMSQFNIRCDGVLQSSAASLGSFVDLHSSAGTYTPLKFLNCTRFKLYGKGYINPGFVDALNITTCSDFDIALDCRGTNQNSVMRGILIQECFRFRVHDMTIDSITGLNVQGALTTNAVVNSGATSATASTWTGGAGSFSVVFTEVAGGAFETRAVTFGSGTSNVSMTWAGGLSANCTATFYAEIYYDFLAALTIFSCYEFKIDHNFIKGHGGNGVYVLSVGDGVINNCHDFDICDNLIEFNAESGIQLTYGGGSVCPNNYRVNNNTLKNNQADGIDAANTGAFANIFAQFNNNFHTNNGFINFNPANPGGVDGSGIGTFANIGQFEAIGNTVLNCNNACIYVSNCTQWRIADCVVGKSSLGSSQGGVYIAGSSAGSLRDCDVSVLSGVPSLSTSPGNNIIIDGCNFSGGGVSLASGTYTGSKISRCSIVGVGSINGVMDMIDNNIILTGSAPVGIVASAPNLKFVRNTINAPGPAISTNTANYISIEDNICTVSAAQSCILVTGSNGCVVSGNNATATTSPAIQLAGSCDHTVVSGNKVSGSGNGVSYGASTLTSAFGNLNLAVGGTSLGTATFQVNFPN